MPDPTPTPATSTPVVGTATTATKTGLLSKVETFFEDAEHYVVSDFEAFEADIKAVFAKHAKPTPTVATPPAASAPPAAQTPPATAPVAPAAS